MERIAVIEYKITPERITNSYYAKHKVKYEEYSKEIYDSMSDRVKNIRTEFDEDRFIIENLVKNEKNEYLYDELFSIEKNDNGYLFCYDKVKYNFFEFNDFKSDELNELDKILKKYYMDNSSEEVAVIENYVLDQKRVIIGMKSMHRKMALIMTTVFPLLFGLINYVGNGGLVFSVIECIFLFLLFNFIFYFSRKRSSKKIIASINENFLSARIVFYSDRLESIAKKKYNLLKMNYAEFYKIEKVKKGYIFYTQKYSFYFFWFDEFQKDELEKMDVILSEYAHKKGK